MIIEKEVKEKTEERFWSKIKFSQIDECWEWMASLSRSGYGRFRGGNENGIHKTYRSSRYMYQKIFGLFDKKLNVCHSCDNPKCVNPNHLWLGTHRDNEQDKLKKGRGANVVGVMRWNAKLSDDKVRIIKLRISAGETNKSISSSFQIDPSVISEIKTGKTWVHVSI